MKRMVESEIADILNEKLQVDENGIELKDSLHVDGKISGGEIVEDMSGYSYQAGTNDGYTVTAKYVGVVKNGNKLTLTFFGSVKRTSDTPQYNFIDLGYFTMPNEVFSKLVSYTIGSSTNQYLDNRNLALFASNLISTSKPATILKGPNNISMYIYSANDLSTSNTYLVRYEATFLLSENLAA